MVENFNNKTSWLISTTFFNPLPLSHPVDLYLLFSSKIICEKEASFGRRKGEARGKVGKRGVGVLTKERKEMEKEGAESPAVLNT